MASISNSLLLFTLHKDPLKCFHRRASTVFIQGLALSDFLVGIFVQPVYVISLSFEVTKRKVKGLHDIAVISSHVGAKISILTLMALAVDRLLAITLPWKYNTIVTRRRVMVTTVIIWLSIAVFEASHSVPSIEQVLHEIDLHLQTTVPVIGLLIIFIATYLSFRKHSRNTVFAQSDGNRSNQNRVGNLRFEKRILITILLIMIVVLVSLSPYLIVQYLAGECDHGHRTDEQSGDHDDNSTCEQSSASAELYVISKVVKDGFEIDLSAAGDHS
ncbi:hypothetical protein QZH41_007799 [Actinostola sp. cb2023]|nr:hypothetical protein QZH41_007799 [Actinostola sp. cb2023]